MPAGPVIANNTPLVALWVLGRLELLRDPFGEVLIPLAVHEEFLATKRTLRQVALDSAGWIKAVPLANPQRVRVYTGLDRGEAEVLAPAEEWNARLVIVNERRGRRYAQRLGLPLTGTMGVLLLAKETGLLADLSTLLLALQESGLYLHPDLVDEVRRMAGES
jgi:predicted nucleic acid-binding protein